MIDYTRALRAIYNNDFSGQKLSHPQQVLLTVVSIANGIVGQQIPTSSIKKQWPKTLFLAVYHSSYLLECESNGWIERKYRGVVQITDSGLDHMNSLSEEFKSDPLADSTEVLVFSPKKAHDFDSFLRKVFSSAKHSVKIADSYVDETIFDTLLSSIPSGVRIDVMINHGNDAVFLQRSKRFQVQYPLFHFARYPKLHDRYVIVDGIGFIVGPSLKDATLNAPAIVVRTDSTQSTKLLSLFDNIYSHITKII